MLDLDQTVLMLEYMFDVKPAPAQLIGVNLYSREVSLGTPPGVYYCTHKKVEDGVLVSRIMLMYWQIPFGYRSKVKEAGWTLESTDELPVMDDTVEIGRMSVAILRKPSDG